MACPRQFFPSFTVHTYISLCAVYSCVWVSPSPVQIYTCDVSKLWVHATCYAAQCTVCTYQGSPSVPLDWMCGLCLRCCVLCGWFVVDCHSLQSGKNLSLMMLLLQLALLCLQWQSWKHFGCLTLPCHCWLHWQRGQNHLSTLMCGILVWIGWVSMCSTSAHNSVLLVTVFCRLVG